MQCLNLRAGIARSVLNRKENFMSHDKADKPRFVLKKYGPRKFKVTDTRTGKTVGTTTGTKKEAEKFLSSFVSTK